MIRAAALAALLLLTGCVSGTDEPGSRSTIGSSHSASDPATKVGGCELLVGDDDLVQETLDFGHLPAEERNLGTGSALQNRLFALVVADNKLLGDAAGQLVDYLDDPDAYNRGAGTIPTVTRAVNRIRTVCGKS